jgi:hypothetical protein
MKIKPEELFVSKLLNDTLFKDIKFLIGDNIAKGLPDIHSDDFKIGIEVAMAELEEDFMYDSNSSKIDKSNLHNGGFRKIDYFLKDFKKIIIKKLDKLQQGHYKGCKKIYLVLLSIKRAKSDKQIEMIQDLYEKTILNYDNFFEDIIIITSSTIYLKTSTKPKINYDFNNYSSYLKKSSETKHKLICKSNNTKDSNSIIMINIAYISICLLDDCEDLINNGKLSFAYPIMRQIYEYLIILMAFDEKIISVDDFVREKFPSDFLSNLKKQIIINNTAKQGLKRTENFKLIMMNLWDLLCERTHANFDRLLFQDFEYDIALSKNKQLANESTITFILLEKLIEICINYLLCEKNTISFNFDSKKIKFDSKININRSENGLFEKLASIPNVETLFRNRFKDINEQLKNY